MKFTFNRGAWEKSNPLPEWEENEDFDAYMTRIGFRTVPFSFGREYGSQIEIYESKEDIGLFCANVSPSGAMVYEVFLPDFPSMMMFVRDYATAFSMESSNGFQQEILEIIKKKFLSD